MAPKRRDRRTLIGFGDDADNPNTNNSRFDPTTERSGVGGESSKPLEGAVVTKSQMNQDGPPSSIAIESVLQQFSDTENAIKSLHSLCKRYAGEISVATRNFHQLCDLREEVSNQKTAIRVLQISRQESEAELNLEKEELENERKLLEDEKANFKKEKASQENQAKLREADRQAKHENDLAEKKAALEREYKDKRKEMEKSMTRKEENFNKKIDDLETKIEKLNEQLEENKRKIDIQNKMLEDSQSANEDLERVNKSLKQDIKGLEKQLNEARNEFALNKVTAQSYQDQFTKIYNQIVDISHRYFRKLKDIVGVLSNITSTLTGYQNSKTHEQLKDADISFSSLPISNSADSQALRTAHAQCIISTSLREIIWRPFSSDKLSQNSKLPQDDNILTLLDEIANVLRNSQIPNSGHVTRVWSALTARALQASSSPSPSSRAQKVYQEVSRILSPLVNDMQRQDFKKDIIHVAESAASLWDTAQIDELEIEVCARLDPSNRKEWRSVEFDPPSSLDKGGLKTDIPTSTRNRIYVLFPRIVARSFGKISPAHVPPGGWPEVEEALPPEETCIHPGVGLAEWSTLVIRGEEELHALKEEESKRQKFIEEALKEWEKQRLLGFGSLSPTAQWGKSIKPIASED